jgi:hypothetical protein
MARETFPPMEPFPARLVLASFILWLSPVPLYFLFGGLFDTTVLAIVVLALTWMMPITAYVLYQNDKQQADGYVTAWGYR